MLQPESGARVPTIANIIAFTPFRALHPDVTGLVAAKQHRVRVLDIRRMQIPD